VKPTQQRECVRFLQVGFRVSERRACRVVGMHRTRYRYRSRAQDQTPLRQRVREIAAVRVRYSYRRVHTLLRREGWPVNAKRVYRLYRLDGLSLRLKTRKKRISAPRTVPQPAQAPNEQWSMDFMSDSLYDGRRFRVFTLVDNMSRESPAIVVDRSFSGTRVVAVLNRLEATWGLPKSIQVDNGPEFSSKALDDWAHRHRIKLVFSRPGTPTDNPYIEAFNGRFRAECLDQHWFASLEEARQIIEAWRIDYNEVRPHTALDNQTPAAYKAAHRSDQAREETG
jgi:putative transposase